MAITAANKTAAKNDTDGTSWPTASVAFTASKLYIVAVAVHAVTPTITLSGGGLTYTDFAQVDFSTIAVPNKHIRVFRCLPGSDSTTAVTITSNITASHAFWSIDEFDGIDTSGSNGSGAIVQSATNRSDSASSLTVTLAGFGSVNNAAYGTFARSENQNLTPGAGFTQLSEVTGTESPTTSTLTEWLLNDATVDYSSATAGACAGIGVEIKAAVAGGTTVTDPFGMSGFFGG